MKALDGAGFVRPEPQCTTVARYYEWKPLQDCWVPTGTARWFIHRHNALYWVVQKLPQPRPHWPESARWFIHEQDLRGHCRIYPIPLND